MKFGDPTYQKVDLENKLEEAENRSKEEFSKRVTGFIKDIFVNYNPFIGILPIKTQYWLKENTKIFKSLKPEKSTLASAIGLGLGAYFIGINLDGFDPSFEMMKKIMADGQLAEIPKYISFPFIWGGFSQEVSQAVSYYLLGESTIRTLTSILGKPLGFLPCEGLNYILRKKSEKSKGMQERKEMIQKEQEDLDYAARFINKEQKNLEDQLAKVEFQIWNAKREGKDTLNLETKKEKILKKIEEELRGRNN